MTLCTLFIREANDRRCREGVAHLRLALRSTTTLGAVRAQRRGVQSGRVERVLRYFPSAFKTVDNLGREVFYVRRSVSVQACVHVVVGCRCERP